MMKRLIYSLLTFFAVVMVSQIAVINWRYHTLSYERYRKGNATLVTGYIEKLTWNALNKSVETDVQKTERTRELKETQILQPLPNHRSDREHTGHDNLVNDTITAAIFSCNLHWISKGEQQRFPRTFECPHTDKRITFIAAIEDESAIKDVDVVIFAAGVNSSTWERAMAVRKAHQVWVYSTAESPGNSPQALTEYELVPIVVGASKTDYERVAPPNSFIFADDFDSVRDLARYIRKVATNTTLYNQYHHWRLMGKAFLYKSVRVYPFSSTEGACALLNFLEENAWKGNHSLSTGLDPFGSEWLGSCGLCGKHDWMTAYDIASNAYLPNLRTVLSNSSLYGVPFAHSHPVQG
ncbi:putative fucosyltransferase-like protein [Apostichopus japonicus]|uniref:Fucosyltransferase n=1 Tax=Stichopus japonicus TaxID=307972 RepID=A0A2G8LHF9_STIJA|nr:putative fucosyltransferase-like protein [Apostichopus japonicus]